VIDDVRAALADRYSVERELGSGGMATVYLAHDQKHDRAVAIKVLHRELGLALGDERFLSEIRTTAKLQHPHILPLLESGTAQGLLYYVMPYVAGETLRTRLERERQLPIDDAIGIAREVADALGAAHALGIIHRDIKPENILLQGGHALVADFGIALAVQQAGGHRMTQTGLSLGTPQYMSPEQAMGERTIDARSDIYALGAVTYEMLAGDPPFTGSSVQAIVAKVLSERPTPLSTVRDTVPSNIEGAVLTALAKLPADRYATAAEFAAALVDPAGGTRRVAAALPRAARRLDPLTMALGALVMVLAATTAWLAIRVGSVADPFPIRSEISNAGAPGAIGERPRGSAALAPDGHSVVFVTQASSGSGSELAFRRLDQLTVRPIPGTANAASPVFSPDGKWVAFIMNRRRVLKVPLDGGPAVPLGDVPDNGGIDWGARGDIVAGAGVSEGQGGLLRLNSSGGAAVPLTRVNSTRNELSHQWPRILADGRTVLFTIWYGSVERSELGAASLDDGQVVPLGIEAARALGVAGGYLVYVRADGVAMAVPFDVRRRRASGTPMPVQDSIRILDTSAGDAEAFLTHAGGLVFARGSTTGRLLWVDRTGATNPAFPGARDFRFARLSPDGRRAAITIGAGTRAGLWILDLAAGTLTPITTAGSIRNPVWAPDGRRILYVSTQSGRAAFWWQPSDGSGEPTKAGEARHNPWNIDLAPDGRTAVFNAMQNGSFDLEAFTLDSTRAERELAASPAREALGRFSPDGSLVAYTSDESGRTEVYLRPFPENGGRVQVSLDGGTRPVWARDGKRIFYWENRRLVAATIARNPGPTVVGHELLLEGTYEREFDVSPDGQRFLLVKPEASGISLVVIPDWLSELHRLTGSKPPP
jgi:serine/threonine-protein kinase